MQLFRSATIFAGIFVFHVLISNLGCKQKEETKTSSRVGDQLVVHENAGTALEVIDDPSKIKILRIHDPYLSDVQVQKIVKCKDLEAVYLFRSKITPKSALTFNKLSCLQSLGIVNCNLQDEFVQQLNCEKLAYMNLANSGISSAAFKKNVFLRLVRLDVSCNSKIDEQLFIHLAEVKSLRILNVSKTSVFSNSKLRISNEGLTEFYAKNTSVDEFGIKVISELKKLRVLDLSDNRGVTTERLKSLKSHPKLFELNLGNTSVDDRVFSVLTTLSNLGRLHIYNCNISENAIAANLEKLPRLSKIDIEGIAVSEEFKQKLKDRGITVVDR